MKLTTHSSFLANSTWQRSYSILIHEITKSQEAWPEVNTHILLVWWMYFKAGRSYPPCPYSPLSLTLWCTWEPEERKGLMFNWPFSWQRWAFCLPWHLIRASSLSLWSGTSASPEILARENGASSFQCWAWSHSTCLTHALWVVLLSVILSYSSERGRTWGGL